MKRKALLLLTLLLTVILSPAQTINFTDTATVYFAEVKATTASYKDLWNLDLYGPILLIDPGSRKIFANYPDSTGMLLKEGIIYTGHLPEKFNLADTSITWNGISWAMVLLPLPENKQDRMDLLTLGLFHRSQPLLGFHMTNSDNYHLDQRDGRIYLRLELEALRKALVAGTNSETLDHLANAMFFRKTRYSLFPGAASGENRMELNEGVAAYTGLIMSGRREKEVNEFFEHKLTEFQSSPTFVRSFAYVTIPIYGFILNRSDNHWNRQISDTTNLTGYFINAFKISVPIRLCPDCLNQYGYDVIINEETKREKEKEERIGALPGSGLSNIERVE